MDLVLPLLVIAVIAVAVASASRSRRARTEQSLRLSKRRPIASFSEAEPSKIVGTLAYVSAPLISPLTGRRCAYYEVLVEEYDGRGASGDWSTLIHETKGQSFALEDESGRAIVDPQYCHTAIVVDSHTKSGTFNDPTQVERAYLESHGRDGQGWVFNKTLRYKEGILEAGEELAVLGRGTKEPDPDGVASVGGGYRSGPPMRLRMRGTQSEPLLISDEPSTF